MKKQGRLFLQTDVRRQDKSRERKGRKEKDAGLFSDALRKEDRKKVCKKEKKGTKKKRTRPTLKKKIKKRTMDRNGLRIQGLGL